MRAWPIAAVVAVAAVTAGIHPTVARAEEPPVVDLITMGPGNDVFEAFGHAALCVTDAKRPRGECYNYGYTDFSDLTKLVTTFIQGKAKFWAQPQALSWVLESYTASNRDVYRQRLPLTPDAVRALVDAMERDLLPENRYYFYHHFHDNCTTRLRDHIDRATGGALSRGADVPYGATFRQLARRGYAGKLPMLLAVDMILGEPADRPATVWQAMFLPNVLRAQVELRLGVKPVQLNARQGAPFAAGSERKAQWFFLVVALFLGALAFVANLLRRPRFLRRAVLVLVGLVCGLVGVAFYTLAIVSVMPELRKNELMLVFMPTDLALLFLGGRSLFIYLCARVGVLVLVVLGLIAGILVQPLFAPLLIPLLPLASYTFKAVREARERALLVSGREVTRDERAGAASATARRGD